MFKINDSYMLPYTFTIMCFLAPYNNVLMVGTEFIAWCSLLVYVFALIQLVDWFEGEDVVQNDPTTSSPRPIFDIMIYSIVLAAILIYFMVLHISSLLFWLIAIMLICTVLTLFLSIVAYKPS